MMGIWKPSIVAIIMVILERVFQCSRVNAFRVSSVSIKAHHGIDTSSLRQWANMHQSPPASKPISFRRNITIRKMCGLVAAVEDHWSSTPSTEKTNLLDPKILLEATRLLDHRGPDGHQIHHSQEDSPCQWGMGHTRLAIVDPSNRNADMPFALHFDDDRTIHLAANGEIYNHETLYNSMSKEGWSFERISGSDCEVIAHAYAKYGGPKAVEMLDGMFAFVVFEEDDTTKEIRRVFAARDPVGIKPLYYGMSGSSYVFASELKALVNHVDVDTVVAIPAGHYWTPETGLVCYYNPEWLRNNDYKPWEDPSHIVTDDEIRAAFTKAIEKRMMADVDYGFFLSGGIDSCVVAHDLLPLYRKQRQAAGDFRPIKTYTVGMENSPDVMAAKAMVEALGGASFVEHHVRTFTPDEVFDLIPKIVYHMETYEAELIRSSIPNWLLAERASKDVKMVLTGEGSDELFAGYLYFQDADSPKQVQDELRRIYGMLGNINLHRTDRMTMAHGLEARVPFLDTEFTRLIMSVDPKRKVVDREAVKANARGREKTFLREMFEGPNENGHSIPRPVLWRAKAMQCEGVGEDWVSILQKKIATLVSDAEMEQAHTVFPMNTPQTKEELYYRKIFNSHFHGMDHVVNLWEGGGRAMGAAWKSDMYTREGLRDVKVLSHSLQKQTNNNTTSSALDVTLNLRGGFRHSPAVRAVDEACAAAKAFGYNHFEALLTTGGDDRSIIKKDTGTNKYHIRPQPVEPYHVFRGSCTGNPPTARGYDAAKKLYDNVLRGLEGQQLSCALSDVFADHRRRITGFLNLPDGAEVVLCPSGSDAEYIPLAIAQCLRPGAKITSGVAQLREIGAGSAPAAMGRYFATHAPLIGRIPEGLQSLAGFEGISGLITSAREADGSVVKSSVEMASFVENALNQGLYPIAHGVFGGKTGIRDSVMPASLDEGLTSLGVVDACQGRFTRDELHQWLSQDSLVLFTGSKFFQAPPFCGAVIIPPRIAKKLQVLPPPKPQHMCSPYGLGGFITDKEIPNCLHNWAPLLADKDSNNVGLALRWEAGLAGMETLASCHNNDKVEEAIKEWATTVSKMIQQEQYLDVWCVERSILSIRVAKDDGWCNMEELRDLYRWMSMDVSDKIPNLSLEEYGVLSKPTYIGQPVDVSEQFAVVRTALGVDSLLSYLNNEMKTLEEDRQTARKLSLIAKHFDVLRQRNADSPVRAASAVSN